MLLNQIKLYENCNSNSKMLFDYGNILWFLSHYLLILLITFDAALWNSTSNMLLHVSVLSKEKK